jgi:mono/diheme cytochrome c family protein
MRAIILPATVLCAATLVAQYGAAAPAPAAPVAAPSRASATPPAATPEVLARGKEAFARYCVGCHGPRGAGDGPAASSLKPPPKDLSTVSGGAPAVFAVLETGVKGTAMIDFQHLSEDDRWAIAHYVNSLRSQKKSK